MFLYRNFLVRCFPSFKMDDTPVPTSHAGVVNGALLEAAAEAVEDASVSEAPAYKGVYKTRSNKFEAKNYDTGTGKSMHLGSFDTAEEAARAFDAHARSEGDKALNFPNAQTGEVQAVKGGLSKSTLKRAAGGAASGGAASSARKKRAAPAAGAAAASPAKQPPKASCAKAAPRPPPLFRGTPFAVPQKPHPPPPPQQQQPQQPTLPPPLVPLPPQPPAGGARGAPPAAAPARRISRGGVHRESVAGRPCGGAGPHARRRHQPARPAARHAAVRLQGGAPAGVERPVRRHRGHNRGAAGADARGACAHAAVTQHPTIVRAYHGSLLQCSRASLSLLATVKGRFCAIVPVYRCL